MRRKTLSPRAQRTARRIVFALLAASILAVVALRLLLAGDARTAIGPPQPLAWLVVCLVFIAAAVLAAHSSGGTARRWMLMSTAVAMIGVFSLLSLRLASVWLPGERSVEPLRVAAATPSLYRGGTAAPGCHQLVRFESDLTDREFEYCWVRSGASPERDALAPADRVEAHLRRTALFEIVERLDVARGVRPDRRI